MPICVAGGWLVGCGQVVHDLGREAGGGAASGVIAEAKRPDTQQALADVAASPGVQQAGQAAGIGLGRGVLDEALAVVNGQESATAAGARAAALNPAGPNVAGPAASTQPGGLAAGDTEARAARFVREDVNPLVGEVVRSAVRQGVQEAASPQSRQDVTAIAQTVGQGATHGVATALAGGELDPAVARLVRSAVREAVQEALGPQTRAGAGDLAEAVAGRATHGVLAAVQQDGGPVLDRFTTDQLGPAVDRVFADHVRPALRDFFRQDIAPTIVDILKQSAGNALQEAVTPANQAAVIQNSVNLSKGATFGSHDAAVDLGLLARDGSMTLKARLFFYGVVAVVILAGLVAVGFLVVLTLLALSLRRGRTERPT